MRSLHTTATTPAIMRESSSMVSPQSLDCVATEISGYRLRISLHAAAVVPYGFQICRQQPVKQVFARLTPHGQPARAIRSRFQPALHRFADAQVFILNAGADSHALLVVLAAGIADIAEVEIEDHAAMIDVDRKHQIRIHV